ASWAAESSVSVSRGAGGISGVVGHVIDHDWNAWRMVPTPPPTTAMINSLSTSLAPRTALALRSNAAGYIDSHVCLRLHLRMDWASGSRASGGVDVDAAGPDVHAAGPLRLEEGIRF
ncbi:MAG: hypothetical protein CYPHOPRED_000505, partial [Cyphobasidiales sp. Tagirdzhanova-0007]